MVIITQPLDKDIFSEGYQRYYLAIGVTVIVHVVVVVIPVVDPRNLPLKFGLNQVINRRDVVDVVVVIVVVIVNVVDPRNLLLKLV